MNQRSALLTFAMATSAFGCAAPGDTNESGEGESTLLASTNGLSMINGLSMTNGLNSVSGGLATGLNTAYALNSSNGLSSTVGLMTTSAGRSTVSYLVRCALPSGHSLRKQDQYGTAYTFAGAMGLAPGGKPVRRLRTIGTGYRRASWPTSTPRASTSRSISTASLPSAGAATRRTRSRRVPSLVISLRRRPSRDIAVVAATAATSWPGASATTTSTASPTP